MAKIGKRYPLLIYNYTLSKWYPATLAISIVLFILWWFMPSYTEGSRNLPLLLISSAAFIMTLFLFFMRKAAYVRPYAKHLRLVTPFLRMNISYKRIIQTRPTKMADLFPPSTLSSWQRESMAELLRKQVLVVELNAYPMPRTLLRFFLSPFFFKDNTPHFVFLIDNWMSFSTELESLRTGGSLPNKKRRKKNRCQYGS